MGLRPSGYDRQVAGCRIMVRNPAVRSVQAGFFVGFFDLRCLLTIVINEHTDKR